MSNPFVAEIRIFAGNFAPRGWAFCNGQLLPIQQNTALFSLLGTTYGGNGTTNFALPNLQNSAPMQPGQGAGLTQRVLGESGGSATVTLLNSELPAHIHVPQANNANANNVASPANTVWAVEPRGAAPVYGTTPNANMNAQALSTVGSNQPHNNMQPYLGLTFIVCLQGIYPSRN